MTQLVFIHGPGAGACGEGYAHQLSHFPGSLAPDLPGHLEGKACSDVARYAEWLRGWLWAQDIRSNLILVGFTLGSCIALQYALDYPEEVKGLVLMTVSMRSKGRGQDALNMRLDAAKSPEAYEKWLEYQRHAMMFVDPELRERLLECHKKVGPISQHDDIVAIDKFDVADRIGELKTPLTLIRGVDDPVQPPEYELEIHQAVPGSKYIKLSGAGHFPMAEKPQEVNQEIEELQARVGQARVAK